MVDRERFEPSTTVEIKPAHSNFFGTSKRFRTSFLRVGMVEHVYSACMLTTT